MSKIRRVLEVIPERYPIRVLVCAPVCGHCLDIVASEFPIHTGLRDQPISGLQRSSIRHCINRQYFKTTFIGVMRQIEKKYPPTYIRLTELILTNIQRNRINPTCD